MKNAKELDFITWEDRSTGIQLFGRVRRVLEKSVIVDVVGLDDATVVNHKRYRIIEEAEIDESTAEQFRRARKEMGKGKLF